MNPLPQLEPPHSLHNRTTKPIQCPLNPAAHDIPIRSSLRKLINLLGAEHAPEAIPVGDEGRKVLGVARVDEVELGEFAQGGEVLGQGAVTEGGDIGKVVVHVAGLEESVWGVEVLRRKRRRRRMEFAG